jgi:hypothetical protein
MKTSIAFAMLVLVGCATTPEQLATQRFESCMQQTIGPFGIFAGIEARRQAAETCKSLVQTTGKSPT